MHQTPTDLVRSVYLDFSRADLPSMLSKLAPDASWRSAGPRGWPCTGEFRGPTGARAFFDALFATVRLTAVDASAFLADGETVVVLGKDLGVVHATGAEYEADWVHVWTVRGGKVAGWHEFLDVRKGV
ncbi:MAG: nuclear transport factor 2 family protein [Planctomycetes bacterium]|nr:nuclear transport factor 2 family protein [Planctomycetota bacterium]